MTSEKERKETTASSGRPTFGAPSVTAKVHPVYGKKVVEVTCKSQ
jgi:hypothetical protein